MTRAALTLKSRNAKTGPIPVSTSERSTCPPDCPFKDGPCYAEAGFHTALHWDKVTNGSRGTTWREFCQGIARLAIDTLWRHDIAGDLPGRGARINRRELRQLTRANTGRRGFTYTHKYNAPGNLALIREANADGFTINLSANNLRQADTLADTLAGPVVVVTESDTPNHRTFTPAGRLVITCPATYQADRTCANCGLCQRRDRQTIVAFPAHGTSARAAREIAAAA